MSLRPVKVGILKSGFKNLNVAGLNRYCTKPTTPEEKKIIFVANGSSPQRRSNEILAHNPRFPFQGGIGIVEVIPNYPGKSSKETLTNFKTYSQPTTSSGLSIHRLRELPEILESGMRFQVAPDFQPEQVVPITIDMFKADRDMELKVMLCPKKLKKTIGELFVDVEILKENDVTVLNLTQKSTTDMSAWSEEMEKERDVLVKDFINVATAICTDLQKASGGRYWADFIEPSSGRPYFGQYTNATLFEVDERYRDLGFQIEDLGCCKVIKHMKWKTHAFVGTIFTDAPMDSEEVKAIMKNSQANVYFEKNTTESEIKPESE